MAAEMAINLSQLQELVGEVQKTQQAQTVRLADGVVAVVKPERPPVSRKAAPAAAPRPGRAKAYTLEEVFGVVADTGGPRDFDQMIREAKEERADHLLRQLQR